MPSARSLLFDCRDALLPVPFHATCLLNISSSTEQYGTRDKKAPGAGKARAFHAITRAPRKSRQGREGGVLAHLHTTPNRYVGMPYAQCGVFRRCAYTQEILPPVFFSERLFSLFSLPCSRGAMTSVCQPTTPRACG